MNERIKELAKNDLIKSEYTEFGWQDCHYYQFDPDELQKFAELIIKECINREELLGAIARGWCSEKNSHKTMDPDLALAIFNEVEKQIREHFGIE